MHCIVNIVVLPTSHSCHVLVSGPILGENILTGSLLWFGIQTVAAGIGTQNDLEFQVKPLKS